MAKEKKMPRLAQRNAFFSGGINDGLHILVFHVF
jgi:hypothetical protein